MTQSISDPEVDRLARRLAAETGETLTEAVREALRERLRRGEGRTVAPRLAEELRLIGERCSSLPLLDARPADQILAYDEAGLPN